MHKHCTKPSGLVYTITHTQLCMRDCSHSDLALTQIQCCCSLSPLFVYIHVTYIYLHTCYSPVSAVDGPPEWKAALGDYQLPGAVCETGFLEGCRLFLAGFTDQELEKLHRIINLGGGARYTAHRKEQNSHCNKICGALCTMCHVHGCMYIQMGECIGIDTII